MKKKTALAIASWLIYALTVIGLFAWLDYQGIDPFWYPFTVTFLSGYFLGRLTRGLEE